VRSAALTTVPDLSAIDRIVEKCGTAPDAVLPILHAIQDHYHYLPEEALQRVCALTRITPANIIGVATFYARFRHRPAGEHILSVCHGTACHVKSTELVHDAINRYLKLEAGADTDPTGMFTVERVGCLGCCTLAPVIGIDGKIFGHRLPEGIPETLEEFLAEQEELAHCTAPSPRRKKRAATSGVEFRVSCDSCCLAGGAGEVKRALEQTANCLGGRAIVKQVGCMGMSHQTPLVEVTRGGNPVALYGRVDVHLAAEIVRKHAPAGLWSRLRDRASSMFHQLTGPNGFHQPVQTHALRPRDPVISDFLGPQKRIATEHSFAVDPLDIDDYIAHDGFVAAKKALAENNPDAVIETIRASGLRGRGGAGFPAGEKWARTRATPGQIKYIICNGDEGDPGAFMDRMLLESFPYRVIEGMLIASLAVGAQEGILYIRHEYPLALTQIRAAVKHCEARGFLGENIFGNPHCLRLRVVEGGGAFVCGEETAMIASIEGGRGIPRLRPPFPSESGLWGRPTSINNVETFAVVPWIIRHGPEAFATIGTAKSKGTKTFALTGKIVRGGLIEVPMGITIRQIVQEIGGGVAPGRRFKAVLIGGPSGGCIPASQSDLTMDYESLSAAGAIMGSGGLVVLDDTDCMVDVARYFLQFAQTESCGQCSFCRVGTKVMLEILTRLCEGRARVSDLQKLEALCEDVRKGSLCGLGQTAPNPVLTTLRYFRNEYEAHVQGRCPAGKCKALIHYVVGTSCNGCTMCAQHCPSDAIPMTPYVRHVIDAQKCTRCDVCRSICPEQAIEIVSEARGDKTKHAYA
jgi:NADH-quinone oxidoreductase subunit F